MADFPGEKERGEVAAYILTQLRWRSWESAAFSTVWDRADNNRIARPLLIGQGANDPRVKRSESDQIVEAMTSQSIPVTYVLFPDEGHGFGRPENHIAFMAIAEAFLAGCLGGK